MASETSGYILEVQRFSIHDGPGIRTAVFLKGCPLRCRWCHHPAAQRPDPELGFRRASCRHCGACVAVCPSGAHRMVEGQHHLDRPGCLACGACSWICPAQALVRFGRKASVAEILSEALEDRAFFRESEGGLTLTGGEPFAQPLFALALLAAAKQEGLHTCVCTSGQAPSLVFESAIPVVDCWIYDFKESNPERHLQAVGCEPELIATNRNLLIARDATIILRCPIIPGLNDREDHFRSIAMAAAPTPIIEVHVVAYHRAGIGKALLLGREPDHRAEAPSDQTIAGWIAAIQRRTVKPVLQA